MDGGGFSVDYDLDVRLSGEQRAYAKMLFEDTHTLGVRFFNDGASYIAAKRLLYHYTLIAGAIDNWTGYSDRWCYRWRRQAMDALRDEAFSPGMEPGFFWHKHPSSGRVREDPAGETPEAAAYMLQCMAIEKEQPWIIFGAGGFEYAESRAAFLL